jgi:hypothetical protein
MGLQNDLGSIATAKEITQNPVTCISNVLSYTFPKTKCQINQRPNISLLPFQDAENSRIYFSFGSVATISFY